jgi:hypothetical protein
MNTVIKLTLTPDEAATLSTAVLADLAVLKKQARDNKSFGIVVTQTTLEEIEKLEALLTLVNKARFSRD